MGVRGLWEVVAPAAKPVQLEDLRGQRVAVDASIWIYHFMKAVRDSNGEVLRNAHVIGFFRRICKLIYFGIKPVFVFDGGAPSLKRQTINRRKERREFRQEDAARTAAKLLTVQLERMANQQVQSNKKQKTKAKKKEDGTDDVDQKFVYFDERNLPESTRVGATSTKKEKPFRAQDPYHLPEVDVEKPVRSDDPRLMTQEELAEYAQEFEAQINTGLYDTSKIDFESEQFRSLPKTTQYQLLSAARFKSRLRMGYTAEQLDQKFPDRMEFSRFQVDRVAQRNYLTQSIMNLIGTDDGGAQRISGEKGGEYILNKTEGGWTLSMNQKAASGADKVPDEADEEDEEDEDVEWEDVPLEENETASGGGVTEKASLGGGEETREQKFQVEEENAAEEEEEMVLPAALNDVNARIQRERLKEEISEKRKPKIKHNFGESSLLKIPNTATDGETAAQKDASAHTTSETERVKGASEQRPPTFVPPWFQAAADEHRGVQNVEFRTEEEQGEQMEEAKTPGESENPEAVEESDESPKGAAVVINEAKDVSPLKEGEPPNGDGQDMQQMAIDRELAEQEALYQEEEDEEMLESIARESKENARFTSSLKGQAGGGADIDYEEEIRRLRDQKRKDQRDSDEVSSTMVKECQELLQTFGIPYITAPMEAEAQCATLYELGLVDGIVTDDSDCFLFGGNCIYKNMFNQAKWVECYDTETLQREFNLTREKFIDLAQLLGSDYTEGLLGVGPVTGMEIISEFKDLHDFKQWWEKVQNRQGKQEDLLNNELRLKFKRRFITKLFLRSDFPNEDVRQAYLHPQVDWDETEFEWGSPNVDAIRTFLRQTAGWTPESVDEVVLPVLRNQSKKQTKLNFHPADNSIEKSAEYQLNTSKRMQKAMKNLKRKRAPENIHPGNT